MIENLKLGSLRVFLKADLEHLILSEKSSLIKAIPSYGILGVNLLLFCAGSSFETLGSSYLGGYTGFYWCFCGGFGLKIAVFIFFAVGWIFFDQLVS